MSKKSHALKNFFFKILLRGSSKLYLETSLRRISKRKKFWARDFFFWHRFFFWDKHTFAALCWLWAAITPVKRSYAQKVPHFRKPLEESFHMVLSWKNFPIKKYRGEGFLSKNAVYCYFSCPLRKKFQVAANRTILILEGLPMAHLKAYVPNFPKHMRKRS